MKKLRSVIVILAALFVAQGTMSMNLLAQSKSPNSLMVSSEMYKIQDKELIPLTELLSTIEQNFDVTFLFKDEVVANKFTDSKKIRISDETGEELARILHELDLSFKQIDEQTFALFNKNPSFKTINFEEQVSGTVTDAQDGETLPGVNIVIKGTSQGTTTNAEGNYNLLVPSMTDTLVFSYIGYGTEEIPINGRSEIDVALEAINLRGEEIIVTGVAGEMSTRKTPFSVDQISEDEINRSPASTDPISALQGRVSGVQIVRPEGTPGTGVSVQLRGINSINRGPDPLFIVDGVYMESDRVDLEALDIKNIEVVKGAAAASIYGSRAINGVIRITTQTGSDLQEGRTQVRFRSEVGVNHLQNKFDISRSHSRMIADSEFTDANNNQITAGDWLRTNDQGEIFKADYNTADPDESFNGVAFQDNPYPVFNDHLNDVFESKTFNRNYLSVSKRIGDTNFYTSIGNVRESGVVAKQKGYSRQNLRLNMDHRIVPELQLSLKSYFSVSDRGDPFTGGEIFSAPIFISPAVSLESRDENGEYLIQPDESTLYENPLYRMENREIDIKRNQQVVNLRLDYNPLSWLQIVNNVSYNRGNELNEKFWDIGFKTSRVGDLVSQGRYEITRLDNDHWDASVRATLSRQLFNGNLETKTTIKGITERSNTSFSFAGGTDLAATGVKGLDNIEGDISTSSDFADVRSMYGFISTQLDYKDKYIASFLIRRDGSSKFGPDERWQTYYRLSGAYRLSEEPWWPVKDIFNEFKVRYSYGTAGGQPGFDAQYETYLVSQGKLSRDRLGNKELKPEFQLEQSLGLDFEMFNKVTTNLTYTTSTVEDLLLEVPLPAYAGYQTQWRNAGTISSQSFEAEINASLINSRDLQWTTGLVFSKHRSKIIEFGRTPYRTDPFSLMRYANGESLGSFYGVKYLTDKNELPDEITQYQDQFQVNDEGYLVAVGTGNTWEEGISKELWGTGVDIDGDGISEYQWGMPIQSNSTNNKIGNSIPDFTIGFNTNLSWRGANFYMLWDAQVGGDIYNYVSELAVQRNTAAITDQAGKPDFKKKPISYYNAFNAHSNRYVYDGTYIKLRELAVSYTFGPDKLEAINIDKVINEITLGIEGRNLLTISNYPGFDPEVGVSGDAAELRIETFRYPNYRTLTGSIKIEF